MEQLSMIENELVPVYTTSTGEKVVYGTDLHKVLEVRSPYREWSSRRLSDIEAVKNVDYTTVEISTVVGGMPKKDHIIRLDTAKEKAKATHDINNVYHAKYEGKRVCAIRTSSNEPDSPTYYYRFKNHGFDNYDIFLKMED